MRIIGVLADTATDTAMGREYLESRGESVVSRPVKETTPDCLEFFKRPLEEKEDYVSDLIKGLKAEGAEVIFVNANSICAQVDLKKLGAENGIRIVTPFDAYERLGKQFGRPLTFAVTSGSLNGLEARIWKVNPAADVRGVYVLDIAVRVEAGDAPEDIVENFGLKELSVFAKKSGCDCIIFGCTHFPYIKEAMSAVSDLPIMDPADTMYEMLFEEEPIC